MKNSKIRFFFFLSFSMLFYYSCNDREQSPEDAFYFTNYVDPFIGTAGDGHTFPGPVVPFGMVQLSPDTDVGGWSRCSGYHRDDSSITGFSHTHLSGTGVGDLGDVLVMPVVGTKYNQRGDRSQPDSGYRSRFSREEEYAEPGYYQVNLADYGINVELTASKRVGFHQYTFPENGNKSVLFDLGHGVKSYRGETQWSFIKIINDTLIMGTKLNNGWAKQRYIHFAAVFSEPFDAGKKPNRLIIGNKVMKYFDFPDLHNNQLRIKVGISPVSMDNAYENLLAEVPHWDFNKVRNEAKEQWEYELSKMIIEADKKVMKNFYTAFYHAMIHPSLYMDVDGSYRGSDQETHVAENFTNYTVFSLWDTYRALHPLLTITHQEQTNDFVHSMLAFYDQSVYNMLPVWTLQGWETWTMIGYHSVPVIVDAALKGIGDFDYKRAFEAINTTAHNRFYDHLGDYIDSGYVPLDKQPEAASITLEVAYDDWCAGIMADKMGRRDAYQTFMQRAENFKNIFDPETGFMRARDSDGAFATKNPEGEFDPFYAHYKHDYTEGNAWQYLWSVQHDIPALIDLLGGEKDFLKKLDTLFTVKNTLNDNSPHDISGLIGQYAHGNEPSHHVAYLYNYAGKPWKTQEKTRYIMDHFYDTIPEGLIGNEDCGQMSAWYIFSAMGFYPVNPASGVYVIGSPAIDHAALPLENGKLFEITVHNNGKENIYIERVELNGHEYTKNWLSHEDIMNGAHIEFYMTDKPVESWAYGTNDRPPQSIW